MKQVLPIIGIVLGGFLMGFGIRGKVEEYPDKAIKLGIYCGAMGQMDLEKNMPPGDAYSNMNFYAWQYFEKEKHK